MWIVFGWQKEEKPLAEVCSGYCYECRRETTWVVWNESEWVTFSDIRTLRFVNRNRLHCDNCVFRSELTGAELRDIKNHMKRHDSIDGTRLHARLMKRIESEQLGSKTPLQLKFIRESMAAERDYQERMAKNTERDASTVKRDQPTAR